MMDFHKILLGTLLKHRCLAVPPFSIFDAEGEGECVGDKRHGAKTPGAVAADNVDDTVC